MDNFGIDVSDAGLRPRVICPAGALRGTQTGGVDRFAGIPYAHPPVRERRFAPAEPLAGWSGELDASQFGPASAQVFDPLESEFAEFGEDGPIKVWAGSEDSLTLNIWRPAGGATGLPVLIWIHGGANWLESARFSFYDGGNLAAGGAVFVSLNYRLGLFGFLDLSPIGGPAEAHSNGLTDQLAAIRWVAANIEAFGGDPANMTLMGNSAGAMDASWLLASGRLPTGIRRLVLSSGVASAAGLGRGDAGSAHDPAEGRRRAASFLVALGFKTYEDLWSASTDEILARQAALIPPAEGLPEGDRLFYACTGSFSPRDPFDAAAAGMARGLDVMIGFTAFEMGLWLLWDEMFDARSPEWAARTQLPHVPDSLRDALPDLYRRWLPDESEGRLAMHMVGDAVFAMPAIFLADLLSRNGANVFLYRFDWQVDARFGAAHAFDLPFLFGLQGTASAEQLIGPARDAKDRDARKVLSDMFGKALHGFATNGRPEIAGQKWQRYETDRRMTALLDATPRQVPDPLADRRSWWTSHVLPRALGGGRD